jgi:hypothetical protein
MNLNKLLQKVGVMFLALGPGLFFSRLECIASPKLRLQEQQQPPPPPAAQNSQPASQQTSPSDAPAAKQKKVWTEEDVISLRTPADNYQAEKEAKASADAQAAAKETAIRTAVKSGTPPPLDFKLPATPEETEKRLKDTQEDIELETNVLAKLRKELTDGSAEEQAQKKKEIDRLDVLLEASQRELIALQQHLKTLREKPQGENPPATPPV